MSLAAEDGAYYLAVLLDGALAEVREADARAEARRIHSPITAYAGPENI